MIYSAVVKLESRQFTSYIFWWIMAAGLGQ